MRRLADVPTSTRVLARIDIPAYARVDDRVYNRAYGRAYARLHDRVYASVYEPIALRAEGGPR